MKPITTLAGLMLLASLSGCGAVAVPADRDDAFAQAVAHRGAGRPAASMTTAWAYVAESNVDDPRYDRALRLLALDAEALDLTYAASLWFLEIARGRRAPTLMPGAVRGLERIIRADGGHDDDLLVQGYLAVAEIPGLPREQRAFVDYLQGLHAARQGLHDWANARFARIPADSTWHHHAAYVGAVRAVAKRDLEPAQASLEALLEVPRLDPDLALDVRRSLARLATHAGDHAAAIEQFRVIQAAAPNDPELLLEMAWSHYHAGQTRRALGLLLALDAPIYADLIAPERFLLEALALERLCQFAPARQAAVRLDARHGDALRDLHAGVPALRSASLRAAARRQPAVAPLSRFVDRLITERAQVDRLAHKLGAPLATWLRGRYDTALVEARGRLEAVLRIEIDTLSESLLAAEEGVGLVLHQLGIALLRGRRRPDGPPEAPVAATPAGGDVAVFRFMGEYWTDELDDLVVVAEDRCVEQD